MIRCDRAVETAEGLLPAPPSTVAVVAAMYAIRPIRPIFATGREACKRRERFARIVVRALPPPPTTVWMVTAHCAMMHMFKKVAIVITATLRQKMKMSALQEEKVCSWTMMMLPLFPNLMRCCQN
jgi:hypothetical protein